MESLGSTGQTEPTHSPCLKREFTNRRNPPHNTPGTTNRPAIQRAIWCAVSASESMANPTDQLLSPITSVSRAISVLNTRPRKRLSASRWIKAELNTQTMEPKNVAMAMLRAAVHKV